MCLGYICRKVKIESGVALGHKESNAFLFFIELMQNLKQGHKIVIIITELSPPIGYNIPGCVWHTKEKLVWMMLSEGFINTLRLLKRHFRYGSTWWSYQLQWFDPKVLNVRIPYGQLSKVYGVNLLGHAAWNGLVDRNLRIVPRTPLQLYRWLPSAR